MPNVSASASRRYDAYLVDLDGTLYSATPLKWLMAVELALLGAHHLQTIRAFRREHERLRTEGHEPTHSPYQLQLERTAKLLGKSSREVEAVVTEWMQLRPRKWIRRCARTALLHELEAFRKAGGKLALVSDYPAQKKLAALPAALSFDAVVANGEPGGPGRLKPAPDGYLLAAKRLGAAAERCLVIGDREDADGQAALRAGMDFRLVPGTGA